MTTLFLANTRGCTRDFQAKTQAFQQKLEALNVICGVRRGQGNHHLFGDLPKDTNQKDVHRFSPEHARVFPGSNLTSVGGKHPIPTATGAASRSWYFNAREFYYSPSGASGA